MDEASLSKLPLRGLIAFEAAARLGSFKAAALELNVTPAAISHQVKALETHLGSSLFDRLHRALRLTPAGEQLGTATRAAFSMIERAIGALVDQGRFAGSATLNVTATPSLAVKWLAPRLHRFQERHPQVEVRLDSTDRRADLLREPGVDIALRYGSDPGDASLDAVPLWPRGRVIAVAAPSLAAEGALREPKDVLNHVLLRTAQPSLPGHDPASASPLGWPAWLEAAGVRAPPLRGPHFSNTQLALEAAVAGRGLALAPAILVVEDLRLGRLVQPFSIALPDPFSYWLLCRRDRADEARIRAFVRWTREEAALSVEPG